MHKFVVHSNESACKKSGRLGMDQVINTKPDSPVNPQANEIIERIHQVIGNLAHIYNLQETYVDDADPWMGILAASSFAVRSTYHKTKYKITG